MTPVPRDLGAMIRDARAAAGMTGRQLAVAVDRDPAAISRWEANTGRPTGETVQRLIEVLGLDPAEVYAAEVTRRKGSAATTYF